MANEKDPVCGMNVDPATAQGESTHEGQTYYFCSADCKDKFEANPQQFTSEKGRGANP